LAESKYRTLEKFREATRIVQSARVTSQPRLSRLLQLEEYRRWYDNNGVRIPLYENLTPEQLSLRLPISVGLPRQIIDNSADALFGEGRFHGVEMIGRDEGESLRLQALWERVWRDNELRQRLLTDAIDAGICGGIFYSVSYDPSGPTVFKVQSISYDQLWDVVFDPDDPGQVACYIFQWQQLEGVQNGQQLRRWYRIQIDAERIVRYRAVRPHVEASDGAGVEFEMTTVSDHGLGIIPIVHVPNSMQRMQVIGDSEIYPLIPMLDAINQMLCDAYWQCYNDQAILKAVNIAPPDVDDLEDSGVRLGGDQIHFLSRNEQLVQDIERMKPVGIPESFFKTLQILIAQAYRTASDVHIEPLKWSGSNISGVALRLLYEPLARKTYRKRIWWEAGFERMARIIFAYANDKSVVLNQEGDFVLGGPKYQLQDVKVRWGPLIPGDELEQQRIVLNDLSAGLIDVQEARSRRGISQTKSE